VVMRYAGHDTFSSGSKVPMIRLERKKEEKRRGMYEVRQGLRTVFVVRGSSLTSGKKHYGLFAIPSNEHTRSVLGEAKKKEKKTLTGEGLIRARGFSRRFTPDKGRMMRGNERVCSPTGSDQAQQRDERRGGAHNQTFTSRRKNASRRRGGERLGWGMKFSSG